MRHGRLPMDFVAGGTRKVHPRRAVARRHLEPARAREARLCLARRAGSPGL